MTTNGFVKGKLYRFLDYVLRLVLLNFLVVVPSFLILFIYSLFSKDTESVWFYLTLIPVIIWFFPSIVAVTDVIRQYEDEQTNTIFKDFFKSFANHFIKSFIIGLIIYLLIILFYNSFSFFNINQAKAAVYVLGLIITIAFIFVALFIAVHIPLVITYFSDLTLIQSLKLSLIMAFKDFGRTFLMVILAIIVGVLSILIYYVMFLGGISVVIYFIVKLSFRSYIKIYRKVEKE